MDTDTMRNEFEKDFKMLVEGIDPEGSDPSSPAFKNAVMTGLMAYLLCGKEEASPIKAEVVMEHKAVPVDEVKEEMDDAEKYFNRYKSTNDAMFKQMALDELKHADYVLRQRMLTPMTEEERTRFTKYGEWIKTHLAKMK